MCHAIEELNDIDFIFATGDLAQAYPITEGRSRKYGSHPALRPAQTHDFLETIKTCPSEIDFFTVPGNHDVGSRTTDEESNLGYEAQFMEAYYYFVHGERYFIALNSEVYKQAGEEANKRRQEQNEWLEKLFKYAPKTAPKTVFMHTPLYIESFNEKAASDQGK